MQRRVYAPDVRSNENLSRLFDLQANEKEMEAKILGQKPFKTPNNASKRLLDAIKKIELEYAFNSQESDEDDESSETQSSNSQQYDDYDEESENFHNDISSIIPDYLKEPTEIWLLDSPKNDDELIKPHQSRLNRKFQRITKNQEKVQQKIEKIKEDIEKLDNEYELMDNILDLSF